MQPDPIAPSSIDIVDLGKRYKSIQVLDQLNLCVARGELLVVLGESGSGKSTLLRLIAGLELPQTGSIRIAGDDQSRVRPHKRDVAVVFQVGNGYEHLTVRQNLDLSVKKGIESSQIAFWVEMLKLDETLHQRLSELSGGQSQRVAIARAMLSGKPIVLLDEPLTHLNQSMREEIREQILMAHRETNRTFVYVTHDSDEAFYLADRIAILESGRIQQVGVPRTVYDSPQSKEVAQLLGQPTLDILKLPSEWIKLGNQADDELVECGVRSHHWRIKSFDIDLHADSTSRNLGMSMTDEGLSVRGSILSCKWMGSRWWLEIACPTSIKTAETELTSKIRITCEAHGQDSMSPLSIEKELIEAEKLSRASNGAHFVGYVEAVIPQTSIQTFGNRKGNQ
ncbi:MAG TPA: ABC transporter ATP-binding protein [Pirellula sp.]|nr:ABC transporter ATP-binding protein [Pirellula sp.]